jgi:hypothetical protein
MRCYFMKKGHIAGVEALAGLSDEDAIKKSHELFATRQIEFDGFEVWELKRMVIQWPVPDAVKSNGDAQPDPIFSAKPPSPFQDDAG